MKPVKDLLLTAFLPLLLLACKKESFTDSPSAFLQTTADSLHFDTVFTSTGSVTQVVKIINPNSKGVHIASVRLAGGASSPFKINVDGSTGPLVENIDVGSGDSIYVFVTVTIDPTTAALAFIVQDSIGISYNGNTSFIQLDAYGQNAHFFRNKIITGTETWNNDLPYVILGGITVDTNALLTINKGCRIHFHADAPMTVHGSLQVFGEHWDSTRVVFTGDRLDEPYRHFPASYPGIFFSDVSTNNQLNYAIISNAYQAIVATGPAASTQLSINETIIDNAYDAALIGINSNITARNLLVSNCGKSIQLVKGGNYQFEHTTVACISNSMIQHREPAMVITDFLVENGIPVVNSLSAAFRNCIFWGEENGLVDDEVIVLREGTAAFNLSFDQVLWRVNNTPQFSTIAGDINNQDPLFDSINTAERIYSFRLKTDSPAIDKGSNTGLPLDLDGAPRPVGLPDLGAYEKQ